ncbi:MAG: hypothetical protein PHF79_03195 [Candidatus Pacebacteria bacterium]|nr:hypothetical protein [Candidatus Paceibacterota bacterium]
MNNNFKKQIFDKIHSQEITMYSKLHFLLRLGGLIVLAIVDFSLLAFVLSFVFFSIHESGQQFLLGFGNRGLFTFLELFPWGTIIFTIILLFILEGLVRYFKFGYRLPLIRIFVYALIITVGFSFLVTFTPLHSTLLRKEELGELPVIGGMYEAIHDSHQAQGVIRDTVVSISNQNNSFVVSHNDKDKDTDDGTWIVTPPPGFDLSTISIGAKVYIAGKITGNTIEAYGIRSF